MSGRYTIAAAAVSHCHRSCQNTKYGRGAGRRSGAQCGGLVRRSVAEIGPANGPVGSWQQHDGTACQPLRCSMNYQSNVRFASMTPKATQNNQTFLTAQMRHFSS